MRFPVPWQTRPRTEPPSPEEAAEFAAYVQRWAAATRVWATDPAASVSCPDCSKAPLVRHDVPHEAGGATGDRWVGCPACGAYVAMTGVVTAPETT